MTDVYLDETMLEIGGVSKTSTVGDVIEAVEADLRPYRRFIQELWVDGSNTGVGWKDANAIKEPVDKYDELKLFTGDVDPVVLKGIYTVREYVDFIGELINDTSSALRRGAGEVDNLLGAIIESTGEVVKTMDSLYRCGLSYGIEIFKENPITSYEAILRNMSCLKDARLSRDNILLADILEYELAPLLTNMEEKVFYQKNM